MIGSLLLVAGLISAVRAKPDHDFAGALDDAAALITHDRHQEALDLINIDILPAMDTAGVSDPMLRARAHMLRADALFLADAASRPPRVENAQRVVDEYTHAERLLATLEPERAGRIAEALVILGREDEALTRVRGLPESAGAVRRGVIRRVIERGLTSPGPKDRAIELLTEFGAEPGLSDDERIWTLVTQAKLRLASGYNEEAIDHLLLALHRHRDLRDRDLARLYTILGDAYERIGRLEAAEENLNRAAARIGPGDSLLGEALLIGGRVAQTRGDLTRARDHYAQIIANHRASDAWAPALLGLAQTQALLGESAEAFETFETFSTHVLEQGESPGATRADAAAALLDQVGGALGRDDFTGALQYATIARDLYTRADLRVPAAVSLGQARSARLLADEMLNRTRAAPGEPPDISRLDPVTRAEVRALYRDAGGHFLTHARSMIIADDDAFAESLWNAGECFDLAGDPERAIEVFSEYANGRPNDPRRPAAVFNLAQAHQARGEFATAERFYRALIQENPTSGEGTRSYIWLARAILQNDSRDDDADAEPLLRRVLDGSLLEPDAIEFREALVDLGRFYARTGRHADAIRRFDEAVRRSERSADLPVLRFELADAHRRRAETLARDLDAAMPEADRRRIEEERRAHLNAAAGLYEQARAALASMPGARRSPVEEASLRHAYFYLADTVYELGDDARAIELYDTAAQRYAAEPISLVAMSQIVSAFIRQGRFAEARKANDRARQRLAEFSDEAFTESELPFSRTHWERWLDSTDALSRADGTRSAGAPAENELD